MTIYHGTYCKIIFPKIIEGKYTKDLVQDSIVLS